MLWIVTKYAITAGLVVLISEIAKRSGKAGALIAALPLVTVLTLIWMYVEKTPERNLADHAYYTFWYVIPTLPMFYFFPRWLASFGFWGALSVSVIVTLATFACLSLVLTKFEIHLI